MSQCGTSLEYIMILFLDFDGVLHPGNAPVGADTDFCHIPVLEEWLRQYAYVQIVISSSWREIMKLSAIRELFSPDIRDRIIDVCPQLPYDEEYEFIRHAEILAWLEQSHYQGPWLALDDCPHFFPPDFEQLIVCQKDIGLDFKVIEALNSKLLRIINSNENEC